MANVFNPDPNPTAKKYLLENVFTLPTELQLEYRFARMEHEASY